MPIPDGPVSRATLAVLGVVDTRARLEGFLAWLDARTDREPSFQTFEESPHGVPVAVVSYVHLPEEGDTLAFTFGVSEPRQDGESGSELVLCVSSLRPEWVVALGVVSQRLQGENPSRGETVNFGGQICDESVMSGFLVWDPLVLPNDDSEVIHLGDGHLILVQLVPVHRSELEFLRSVSVGDRDAVAGEFVGSLGKSLYDVRRPPSR